MIEGGDHMKASYHGVEMEGTPREIAECIQIIKEKIYGKEAQVKIFKKQEGQMWAEA